MVFGFFESKSFNPVKDIPELKGKTIFVTGGNIGLGKATCLAIAPHNPKHIFLGARSAEKAAGAIKDIKQVAPNVSISFVECDLASLPSVKKAAAQFESESERLDVLFCNAGIMALPAGLSTSGYETQFGTNHVGHAALIKLLLPTLQKTAKEPNSDVRIVALSSLGHNFAPKGGINFSTLKTPQESDSTWVRYGQSKLANILYVKQLAKRYPTIKSVAVHPGFVQTNLAATLTEGNILYRGAMLGASMVPFMMKSAETGALNQLWAAFSGEAKSGEYYEPVGVANRGSNYSNDEKLAERLWEWTEEELKDFNA